MRSEVYFPYFSLDLRFDDRRARELLDPLGIRATPVAEYFDTLIDFAEAARWGRAPSTALAPVHLESERLGDPEYPYGGTCYLGGPRVQSRAATSGYYTGGGTRSTARSVRWRRQCDRDRDRLRGRFRTD